MTTTKRFVQSAEGLARYIKKFESWTTVVLTYTKPDDDLFRYAESSAWSFWDTILEMDKNGFSGDYDEIYIGQDSFNGLDSRFPDPHSRIYTDIPWSELVSKSKMIAS